MTLADTLLCEIDRLPAPVSAAKLVAAIAAERDVGECHANRVMVQLFIAELAELVDDHHVQLTVRGEARARELAQAPSPSPKG